MKCSTCNGTGDMGLISNVRCTKCGESGEQGQFTVIIKARSVAGNHIRLFNNEIPQFKAGNLLQIECSDGEEIGTTPDSCARFQDVSSERRNYIFTDDCHNQLYKLQIKVNMVCKYIDKQYYHLILIAAYDSNH